MSGLGMLQSSVGWNREGPQWAVRNRLYFLLMRNAAGRKLVKMECLSRIIVADKVHYVTVMRRVQQAMRE